MDRDIPGGSADYIQHLRGRNTLSVVGHLDSGSVTRSRVSVNMLNLLNESEYPVVCRCCCQ